MGLKKENVNPNYYMGIDFQCKFNVVKDIEF